MPLGKWALVYAETELRIGLSRRVEIIKLQHHFLYALVSAYHAYHAFPLIIFFDLSIVLFFLSGFPSSFSTLRMKQQTLTQEVSLTSQPLNLAAISPRHIFSPPHTSEYKNSSRDQLLAVQ